MRLGNISYLNSLLYRFVLRQRGYELVEGPPRDCGLRMAQGEIDAALVPVRHAHLLFDLGICEQPLPFGIATKGATWSTLLIGPEDLTDRDYEIVVTNSESSSAAALTSVLLTQRYSHGSVTVRRGDPVANEPRLVIGDRALAEWHRSQVNGSATPRDVGDLWLQWKGLPFVFARWVVRTGLSASQVDSLCEALRESVRLQGDLQRKEAGVSLRLQIEQEALLRSLPIKLVTNYLARFRYRLADDDSEGETQFLHLCCDRRASLSGASASVLRIPAGDAPTVGKSTTSIRRTVLRGDRLNSDEVLQALTSLPASELFDLANIRRKKMVRGDTVTYVVDTNPNYTNVCDAYCSFCAFYRPPGATDGAYTHSIDEVLARIRAAVARGATTVLLQGGHHPSLPLDYYVELVRRTCREFPGVMPHFWSAGEIRRMSEVSGVPLTEVLSRLFDAGQRTIPGGGAEILVDRVRRRISPLKGTPEEWLEVHKLAHQAGFKSTATMMYGHVEEPRDVVEHLVKLRLLQDRTGGFTAFIPWSFKPGPTPLARQLKLEHRAGVGMYLRMIAIARLALDNIDHIQASFFSEGWAAGALALHSGADDVGGTLIEENVHKAAGYENPTPLVEVQRAIREAGFRARQRDTLYRIIDRDDPV